jgi:hypothetical protein
MVQPVTPPLGSRTLRPGNSGKCNNLSSGVWYRTDKTIIVAIGFRHHRPVLGSFR